MYIYKYNIFMSTVYYTQTYYLLLNTNVVLLLHTNVLASTCTHTPWKKEKKIETKKRAHVPDAEAARGRVATPRVCVCVCVCFAFFCNPSSSCRFFLRFFCVFFVTFFCFFWLRFFATLPQKRVFFCVFFCYVPDAEAARGRVATPPRATGIVCVCWRECVCIVYVC